MSSPNQLTCPSRDELRAFNLGRLSEDRLAAVAAHLDSCPTCAAALATLRDSDDSLVAGLRQSAADDSYLDEPGCAPAVAGYEAAGLAASGSIGEDAAGPPPLQIGRFRIVRELGRGGMGVVYLAHDTQLDRPIALKVPRGKHDPNSRALERFFREARALAAIQHPNLCPIYDAGEADGHPYLAMALLDGELLSRRVRRAGPQDPRAAALVVGKLARAVAEMHRRGVIHRDIKPANVMLTPQGEPVLMDFGLARRLTDSQLTLGGQLVGTPGYIAPELLDADCQTVGPSCDIYGLGMVLYEMLTGTTPFRGPAQAVLSRTGQEEPPPPSTHRPDLDPRCDAICMKAIARAPEERFATADELAAALENFLAPPPPADIGFGRFGKTLALLAVLGLLGLLAALTLWGPLLLAARDNRAESAANAASSGDSPAVAARRWRLTPEGYPSIAGLWSEAPRVYVSVWQTGPRLFVLCVYERPEIGEVFWEGEGTIDFDGRIELEVRHKRAPDSFRPQRREARLNDAGDEIVGRFYGDGFSIAFGWALQKAQPPG